MEKELYQEALEGLIKGLHKEYKLSHAKIVELVSDYGNIKLDYAEAVVTEVEHLREGF